SAFRATPTAPAPCRGRDRCPRFVGPVVGTVCPPDRFSGLVAWKDRSARKGPVEHDLVSCTHPSMARSDDLAVARRLLENAELASDEAIRHRSTVLAFIDREPGAAQ